MIADVVQWAMVSFLTHLDYADDILLFSYLVVKILRFEFGGDQKPTGLQESKGDPRAS